MNSIELMIEEHKNIIRMLKVMRKACNRILESGEICYEDFDKMIDFVRNYADAHHHGKEEKFLFKEMVVNLGKIGTNVVTHGMLVEHDWGRLFISELREALKRMKSGEEESMLDVIANAIGYTNHMVRHISKEDSIVYTFAAKELAPEVLDSINRQTQSFEEEADKNGIQVHYIEILEELEAKYFN
ncbi:MAG: hemerythrin domain-containing protein [Clostridium sp.]|uniref:hemerythrin domain-containing protein n=1 Tax=Clostridium sp. TaxID=1506 RepID=UPI0025BEDEC3|nr:hemerythrin domain-containing protein [Clostridium sp.]MCE5221265.1 hemerythrin domain-containing protein [Clostridium sp.]